MKASTKRRRRLLQSFKIIKSKLFTCKKHINYVAIGIYFGRNYWQNDFFDVVKYVLAYMIVAIHEGMYQDFLFPWLRIAVPLFFIISSYLLFSRMKYVEECKKCACIKKFINRNIRYYLVWLFYYHIQFILEENGFQRV